MTAAFEITGMRSAAEPRSIEIIDKATESIFEH